MKITLEDLIKKSPQELLGVENKPNKTSDLIKQQI